MEDLKIRPEDFGGLQGRRMEIEEIRQRYCCAKGCSKAGICQMGLPRMGEQPGQFQILCQKHLVHLLLLQAIALGDPSPSSEARYIADMFGLNWLDLIDREPSSLDGIGLFNPLFAKCVRCGGGFVADSLGLYAGERFTHTCPKEVAPR